MMTRFRTWLPYMAAIAVYAVLAVLYHYTVGPLFRHQPRAAIDSAHLEYAQLDSDVRLTALKYRAQIVRDTVMQLIPNRPGAFVRLPHGDSTEGYFIRKIEQAADNKPLMAAVGAVSLPVGYGSHPAVSDWLRPTYYMFGVNGNTPYCVWTGAAMTSSRGDPRIGPCRLWARYGGPGPQILNWMDRVGRKFARSERPVAKQFYDRGRPFFMRQPYRWWATLSGQKCIAGDVAVCEAAVSQPVFTRGEGWYADDLPSLFYGEASMLLSLEKQFGPDRFQKFWHSDQAVRDAFQAAFGVQLGPWVHEWATSALEPLEAGPGLSGATILLSLLIISLCAGSVVGIAKRRAI